MQRKPIAYSHYASLLYYWHSHYTFFSLTKWTLQLWPPMVNSVILHLLATLGFHLFSKFFGACFHLFSKFFGAFEWRTPFSYQTDRAKDTNIKQFCTPLVDSLETNWLRKYRFCQQKGIWTCRRHFLQQLYSDFTKTTSNQADCPLQNQVSSET